MGFDVSADAIKAWAQVHPAVLNDALERIHPDDRPSLQLVVAVGQVMAVGVTARDGYCDLTEGQLFDALKGAWSARSIKNAVYALHIAGVVATVRGGTVGKDGKGRGAWRVFLSADSKNLVPAGYEPPAPRRRPQTGHDLSESPTDSQTGSSDSQTGTAESETGQDLSTPKESPYLPTAASARPLVNTPKGDASPAAAAHPPCRTCADAAPKGDEPRRVALAAFTTSRNVRRLSKDTAMNRGEKAARTLRAHYPAATCDQLIAATVTAVEKGHFGPGLHDDVLQIAAALFA